MSNYTTQVAHRAKHRVNPWQVLALFCAAAVLVPLICVGWIALNPREAIWTHLWSTSLPRYFANSLKLVVLVGAATAVLGTGLAWLVTHVQFPGRKWLQYALFFPLAIPAYIAAFAVVDFFEYAGHLQGWWRSTFGYTTKSDYWFPEIRSLGGAAIVFTLTLYPYVYLMARTAFRTQASGAIDVARSLGLGPAARFWRVSLPMARPGIVAGVTIAVMEVLADFGAVEFFAVQTLTTGIFSVWLDSYNVGGAAQIAICLLAFVLLLIGLERVQRSGARFNRSARQTAVVAPRRVGVIGQGAALLACLFVLAIAVIFPLFLLWDHAWRMGFPVGEGTVAALVNSAVLGSVAAGLTVTAGFAVVYGSVTRKSWLLTAATRATTIGYAVPGAVLAIGILVPFAAFDTALADMIENATGRDIGLLFTGGMGALIFAYVVRFFAIAVGSAETGLAAIPPSLPQAARTLGDTNTATLRRVTLPLMRTSMLTALLLVFVDTVKELPATLLLRPFGFETLSTFTYAQASLENIGNASVTSLLIVGLSTIAVIFLAKAQK